ncbi:hypothetical protein ACVPOS_08105 [Staphylococcus aureus]
MPELAEHTSKRERRAICRQNVEYNKSEKSRIYSMIYSGDEFEGIVASVANFGMFIELPNTINYGTYCEYN